MYFLPIQNYMYHSNFLKCCQNHWTLLGSLPCWGAVWCPPNHTRLKLPSYMSSVKLNHVIGCVRHFCPCLWRSAGQVSKFMSLLDNSFINRYKWLSLLSLCTCARPKEGFLYYFCTVKNTTSWLKMPVAYHSSSQHGPEHVGLLFHWLNFLQLWTKGHCSKKQTLNYF